MELRGVASLHCLPSGQVSTFDNWRFDFAGNTSSYEYYPATHANAGRMKCVTGPTGKKTYYEYSLRGEVVHLWGDVPYPEERVYNHYGEMTQLRTYRGGTGWSGCLGSSGWS